ncbi:MAG: hypothetical protein FJ096_14025 [Deltaproteobacteria bacterium]|nr:hypothetical protein [Deltaproteobacteria bacterium]
MGQFKGDDANGAQPQSRQGRAEVAVAMTVVRRQIMTTRRSKGWQWTRAALYLGWASTGAFVGCDLGSNSSGPRNPTVATGVGAGGTSSSSGGTDAGCATGEVPCPSGQFCDADGGCRDGCDEPEDCDAGLCDLVANRCVECLGGAACDDGKHCVDGACVPGCATTDDCAGAAACCGGECIDVSSSLENCGACGKSCAAPHATSTCDDGVCTFLGCEPGFADCDLALATGCERDLADGPCVCEPGKKKGCYSGLPSTEGVGVCAAGTATCNAAGTAFGPCVGEVVPTSEICGNGLDDDCSGGIDDPFDADGDGWTRCDGDCCETSKDCVNPKLVNPGALDLPSNLFDDDCDGKVDNALGPCDAALASNSSNAIDHARALGLCQLTTEAPALLQQRRWGLITASFSLADGTGSPSSSARSIRATFGAAVTPVAGQSMVVLSTGTAASKDGASTKSPDWAPFQGGKDLGKSSALPADWLAANGGAPPVVEGCPAAVDPTVAHDPVQLKLRVRVPTNARSFQVSAFHLSADYPEWVCSPYNDYFLALLDSTWKAAAGQSPNPVDRNLASRTMGGVTQLFGPNLALGNTGLFRECQNATTGCAHPSLPGSSSGCTGTSLLAGTGFDVVDAPPQSAGDPSSCSGTSFAGGGTGWNVLRGNVLPGETVELRFVMWDVGDGFYDSLVLLDDFRWSTELVTPGF